MDEQDQAQQALMQMFRHDRAEAATHPPSEPRWRDSSRARAWLLAIALVVFVLGPTAVILIYPRFGPVDTMTSFCRAEADGDYATAYALLSQRAQQHVSLAAFTKASGDDNLMSCSVKGSIPFIFGGTQASLDVTYQFFLGGANGAILGGSSNSAVDGTMTFVRERGEWRVDSVSPDMFQLSS